MICALRGLMVFGRDACRGNGPAAVIDRIIYAAMEYYSDADEGRMWARMEKEVNAAAQGLAR